MPTAAESDTPSHFCLPSGGMQKSRQQHRQRQVPDLRSAKVSAVNTQTAGEQ